MVQKNFVETLEKSIKTNWELPCFSDYKEEPLKFKDVAKEILVLHTLFKAVGLKRGDKVALCGRNSVNWAVVYLGTVTYGGVIVPILPDFPADDVVNIVNHSDSRIFFSTETTLASLSADKMQNLLILGNLEKLSIVHSASTVSEGAIEEARSSVHNSFGDELPAYAIAFDKIGNDELEGLVYTSGTTGFSKGAMLTHNSLIANVEFAHNNLNLNSGDSIVSFLPIAHCFGCAFEFLYPFTEGCHITFMQRISPQTLLLAFQELHPRLILTVPLVIEKIYYKRIQPVLKKPIAKIPGLKSLLYRLLRKKLIRSFGGNFIEIIIGGAALNPEVEAFFKRINFPFTVGYGMTECGPLISYSPWRKHRLGSAGVVMEYLEGKIDSPDPVAVQGEIMVKGENVMLGYYKNKESTDECLTSDGWLRTGDMGLMDQEGRIFIKGRCKSMLLGAEGQNIYPEEVESILNSMPEISEALIQKDGNILKATVVIDSDAVEGGISSNALEKIRRRANKKLPSYSQIGKIETHGEELHKTPTMKVKRYLYEK